MSYMYEEIENFLESGYESLDEIPEYIVGNLHPEKSLREYQARALQNYFIFERNKKVMAKQPWALFHMATGAGKTLVMAALILHCYKKGYRNFLFFVNQTNIVEKTKDNFLDKTHNKYLFADKVTIDGKIVEIKSVSSFQEADEDSINILFTTIQGLHDRLNTIREDSISYEDFIDKAVLIADEAHHLNANTRLKGKEKKEEENTNLHWEDTVNYIFRNNKENIMLEFTATCDIKNKNIAEKYQGNPAFIVYNYDLQQFRKSGYTKELSNVQTSLSKMQKVLQALLLSQYRLKLFESDDIRMANSKPMVLCKESGKITDLEETYKEYLDFIENKLSVNHIDEIRNQASGFVAEMFDYFDNNNISTENLVLEIKEAFSKDHSIIVHSKVSNIDALQKDLNDLENPDNPYRIVFTLDMLSEGWDVLNLFDIVRLYDERKDDDKKVSLTTIQEAQLIGRGARYFPFTLKGYDPLVDNTFDKRKYSEDSINKLRICETLLYHCIDEPRYIYDLHRALQETGFETEEQYVEFTYKLKDAFKDSDDYKNGKLFVNKQVRKNRKQINSIPNNFTIHTETHKEQSSFITTLYDAKKDDREKKEVNHQFKIKDVDKRIALKALRKYDIFRFDRLLQYFPNLKSLSEFVTSDKYAGRYEINIYSSVIPNNIDIYNACSICFEKLAGKIASIKEELEGTREFDAVEMSKYIFDVPRKKKVAVDELERFQGEGISQGAFSVHEDYRLDLYDQDWFVYEDNYGTTEEKRFVKYFSEKVPEVKNKYDKVFLIRNEEKIKIYTFNEGKPFEPDYILILIRNGTVVEQQQIFIEPKGEHLVEQDSWKQDFLLELEKEANCKVLHSSEQYKILGLPFYTHTNDGKFKKGFEKLL